MDTFDILPGHNWELEITKALQTCHVVIVFSSPRSVTKRGFVQKELSLAVDRLSHKLDDDIYLIPARLEECEVPHTLQSRQWANLFEPGGWERLIAALRSAAGKYNVAQEVGEEWGAFRVFRREIKEEWDGYPGYQAEFVYPQFSSHQHKTICEELNLAFSSFCLQELHVLRHARYDQDYDLFKDNAHTRYHGRWSDYKISHLSDIAASVLFTTSWYGAGAAHPNHGFKVFNFTFEPVVQLELGDFFRAGINYEEEFSQLCQGLLRQEMWSRNGTDWDDLHWLQSGTQPNEGNFESFTFSKRGLTLHFHPYQVHCYAMGSWEVTIPFLDLKHILHLDGPYRRIIPDSDE